MRLFHSKGWATNSATMKNKFTIEEVRKYWNQIALIYDQVNEKYKETHFQRFEEAMKYIDLKPKMKVLNIWSRTGYAISYLKKKCPEVEIENLEVSPKMIEIAQKKYPREKFMLTNLENLPFPSHKFHYILSLETIEHVPWPLKLLKEFYRVLVPQGRLVLSHPPLVQEIPYQIYNFLFDESHGEGPHRFLSSKEVKKMLKEAGFKLILHKGTLLIPLGPKFLRQFGERLIENFQNTFISELGVRQFYVAWKQEII